MLLPCIFKLNYWYKLFFERSATPKTGCYFCGKEIELQKLAICDIFIVDAWFAKLESVLLH